MPALTLRNLLTGLSTGVSSIPCEFATTGAVS